ncbi:MAG: hypothetical protein IPH98_16810 [Saprospiraceae bacterium]|nr:hypothetical protein [Candidatus Defluviibacterium haderslevense]
MGFEISISENKNSNIFIFTERHSKSTNDNGVATLQIGSGSQIYGKPLSSIPFIRDSYYIKISVDINRNGIFEPISESQLLSVPYALASDTANYSFKSSSLPNLAPNQMRY